MSGDGEKIPIITSYRRLSILKDEVICDVAALQRWEGRLWWLCPGMALSKYDVQEKCSGAQTNMVKSNLKWGSTNNSHVLFLEMTVFDNDNIMHFFATI